MSGVETRTKTSLRRPSDQHGLQLTTAHPGLEVKQPMDHECLHRIDRVDLLKRTRMGLCFVPLCSHKSDKDGCKMFRFPKTPDRLAKWKKLIRRNDKSPGKSSRICSCHFVGVSKREPTLFRWNKRKIISPRRCSPKKKCRGVPARQLKFDDECVSDVEHHVQERDEAAQGSFPANEGTNNEGNERAEVREVVEGDILVDAADKTAGNNPDEDPAKSKDRLAVIQEENVQLQARIKELEAKVSESKSVVFEAENYLLQGRVKSLEEELSGNQDVFSFKKISHDKKLVSHYTGLPNKETFYALLALFDGIDIKYAKGWKVVRIGREDQLFLTLIKLRRNLTKLDLGVRFKIDKATVTNIFLSWLMALHHVVFVNLMNSFPSKEKNQTDLPECFNEYKNTRIILDCTEVSTATPPLLTNQNRMYSNYKGRITSKGLVGIAPNGTVVFMSKLFAGSTSDRKIVIETGVLNVCVPGDTVMADKGFNITDLMPDGVGLNIPPFKHNPQFTPEEIEETVVIAGARIHVERAINRIKKFSILDYISQFVLPYASKVFQVCGALTNFQRRLINDYKRDGDEST